MALTTAMRTKRVLALLVVVAGAALVASYVLNAGTTKLQLATDGCQGVSVSGVDRFGGPYPIGGKEGVVLKDALGKVAEFAAFAKTGWNFSKVSCLQNRNLFQDSVKNNRRSNFPFADQYQRYNYVVMVGPAGERADRQVATIRVATWDEAYKNGFDPSAAPFCDGAVVEKGSRYAGKTLIGGSMVNIFPEETEAPFFPGGFPAAFSSPCWVTLRSAGIADDFDLGLAIGDESRRRGILDAHSKHFMLRQAPNDRLASFSLLPPRPVALATVAGHAWVNKATVAYAGEIIMDVAKCTYVINNASGTYRPDAGKGFANLKEVAKLFEVVLGVAPSHVVDGHSPKKDEIKEIVPRWWDVTRLWRPHPGLEC